MHQAAPQSDLPGQHLPPSPAASSPMTTSPCLFSVPSSIRAMGWSWADAVVAEPVWTAVGLVRHTTEHRALLVTTDHTKAGPGLRQSSCSTLTSAARRKIPLVRHVHGPQARRASRWHFSQGRKVLVVPGGWGSLSAPWKEPPGQPDLSRGTHGACEHLHWGWGEGTGRQSSVGNTARSWTQMKGAQGRTVI